VSDGIDTGERYPGMAEWVYAVIGGESGKKAEKKNRK
jgi:hypothetical protein